MDQEEEKEEYEEKRMAEEPKKDRQQELKIIKFHGKADLNIQQWLRLLELKCKQIGLDTKSLVEQLIDILEGDALVYYLDFLTAEKSWKKIRERLLLQFSTQQEDVLTHFLNLKLYELDNLEDYFKTKTNLGTKLGFNEKQLVNSLTQAIEVIELQKLLIANDSEDLKTWKEKAFALCLVLKKEENQKIKHTPTRAPPQGERPQVQHRREPSKPSAPCRHCERRGLYGRFHWQNECRNKERQEGRPNPSTQHNRDYRMSTRERETRYSPSNLHLNTPGPSHTPAHR